MFKNILVAVDGSEHALHAARVAGELALSLEGKLVIVTVFDPVPTYLGDTSMQAYVTEQKIRADKILTEALEVVGIAPVDLITESLEGPVAEAVLRAAEVHGTELIVMGTRGLGRLAGAILGSQSQKVIASATCPVLLVK